MIRRWPRRENSDKLRHQSHANAMKNSFRFMRGCFVLACALVGARAAELPVKDGLLLHLDAANQSTRRQSVGLPSIGNGHSLDRWLDSSGGPLVATQPAATGRPVFRANDAEAFVRFDGKDDYLVIPSAKRRAKEVTIFVLAAPRSNRGLFVGLFGGAVAGQNDYTSGINLDQGPTATKEISVLGVESAGSPGFRNFLQPGKNLASGLPFEHFHVFTVRSVVVVVCPYR